MSYLAGPVAHPPGEGDPVALGRRARRAGHRGPTIEGSITRTPETGSRYSARLLGDLARALEQRAGLPLPALVERRRCPSVSQRVVGRHLGVHRTRSASAEDAVRQLGGSLSCHPSDERERRDLAAERPCRPGSSIAEVGGSRPPAVARRAMAVLAGDGACRAHSHSRAITRATARLVAQPLRGSSCACSRSGGAPSRSSGTVRGGVAGALAQRGAGPAGRR